MKKILGRVIFILVLFGTDLFCSEEVSLGMKSNKQIVFIGEPVVATVVMSEKVGADINGHRYEKPNFTGFLMQEAKNNTTTIVNGNEITELNYFLVPQKAGKFTISPAKADVSILNASQSLEFMGMVMQTSSPQIKHLVSNPIEITVQPAPANVDLVGNFEITTSQIPKEVKANKPIVMRLKIEGNGIVTDLKEFDFGIDGVTTFSSKANIAQDFVNSNIHSLYTKDYTFVSDHNFTIPAQELRVFNPVTKSITSKIVPSVHIVVTGGMVSHHGVVSEDGESKTGDAAKWIYGLMGLILGALVTYGVIVLRHRGKENNLPIGQNVISKLLPYAKNDIEVDNMVRLLYAKQKGDKKVKIDNKLLKKLLTKYNCNIR